MNRPKLFTAAQVAAYLNLSVNRVNVLARSRKLGTKYGGWERLYTVEDVAAMKVKHKPGRPAKQKETGHAAPVS